MGIYYHFANVHGRILLWWTDNDAREHEKWIEGSVAEAFNDLANKADLTLQHALRDLAAL